jgi:sphingosine kinase
MMIEDGEAFPYDQFHVQVHSKIANVLSLDGHYVISEFLQRHDQE